MTTVNTTQKTPIIDKGLDDKTIKKLPGPPEFTEELRMRQETDGVLLESYLIYEPEHQVGHVYLNRVLFSSDHFYGEEKHFAL